MSNQLNNKIEAPNFTQMPNVIFDYWLFVLSPVSIKVLLCLCRKTQIMKMTGLSKNSIQTGVEELERNGLLIKTQHSDQYGAKPNSYSLNISKPIDSNYSDSDDDISGGVGKTVTGGVGHGLTSQKKDYTKENERTLDKPLKFIKSEAKQLDEESSFVRSFSSNEEKITKLLTPLGLNEKEIKSFFKFTIAEVESAIIVLNKTSKPPGHLAGFLNSAIMAGWGPTSTKLDKEREFQEKREKTNAKIIENKIKCDKLYLKWQDFFTNTFYFTVYDNVVIIKVGNAMAPIELHHPASVSYLEIYIEENTKT